MERPKESRRRLPGAETRKTRRHPRGEKAFVPGDEKAMGGTQEEGFSADSRTARITSSGTRPSRVLK